MNLDESVPGGAAESCSTISLPKLLLSFLKMGFLAFGGGMAMVAFMERELVHERRVIPEREFLHGVALGSVLGGYAVNAACFVGYRLHGLAGGALSMLAFLTPATGLMLLLAAFSSAIGEAPVVQHALAGIGPAVIALVLGAAWSMGRRSVRSAPAALLCALGVAAGAAHVSTLYVLGAGALAGLALGRERLLGTGPARADANGEPKGPRRALAFPPVLIGLAVPAAAAAVSMRELTVSCLKIGATWVGGAYTIIPLLYQRLVVELGWMTAAEFREGVALANITPGPIATVATLCGYRVGGVGGGLAATVALFAPSAAMMLFLCRNYARVNLKGRVRDVLDALQPCVVGLVLSAAVLLGRGVMVTPAAWGLGLVALVLLVRVGLQPVWVVLASAAAGVLLRM